MTTNIEVELDMSTALFRAEPTTGLMLLLAEWNAVWREDKTAWAVEVTPRSILRLFDALLTLYPGATITTPYSTVTMESCRATSAYYDEKGIK
jgi:hypothetical protein